jgi:hypothetical protein
VNDELTTWGQEVVKYFAVIWPESARKTMEINSFRKADPRAENLPSGLPFIKREL